MIHDRNTPHILTRSGAQVAVENPSASSINIDDIAWGLAHQFRFGAHTKQVMTVAQHSVHVYERLRHLKSRYCLAGLLHDASEAYLGDMKSPHKKICPDYLRLEQQHMRAIFERFGIADISYEADFIEEADNKQFEWESDALNITSEFFQTPRQSYKSFLRVFNRLA